MNFWLFVGAAWALILAPGPDMLFVISRGMSQGRRAGLVSALGVTLGVLVHTLSAALGLAVLLQASAVAFLVVKIAGAAYLVYLGIKTLRDRIALALPGAGPPYSLRAIFWQGALSNVLNPKVALFFLAFLPQFVNREAGAAPLQMMGLGLTFALFGVTFLSVVGWFAGAIGRWLGGQARWAAALRWLTGGVLVGLGVRLALAEQR